jgi:predicted amidohydrolase
MRVAAFQRFPVFDEPARVGESVLRDLTWADRHGVDLAVFPESYLQGHAYDRPLIERRAASIDGLAVRELLDNLAGVRATVVLGLFERRGDMIFNSAMVIQGGRFAGVYAKAFPIEDGCSPGTEYPVWNEGKWRFGINICNDTNYPEAARWLTDQGANLICAPINNMLRPKKAEIWRARAVENLQACARRTGCWVVTADVAGEGNDGWFSYGCTVIVGPDGTIANRARELVEDVGCSTCRRVRNAVEARPSREHLSGAKCTAYRPGRLQARRVSARRGDADIRRLENEPSYAVAHEGTPSRIDELSLRRLVVAPRQFVLCRIVRASTYRPSADAGADETLAGIPVDLGGRRGCLARCHRLFLAHRRAAGDRWRRLACDEGRKERERQHHRRHASRDDRTHRSPHI